MGETTEISWADHTFNPWIGCTKVSVGDKGACEGCYAEAMMADHYGRVVWGKAGQAATYSRTGASYWRQPLAWNRKAAAEVEAWRSNPFARPETPKPTRFVFCASLADVFDNQVPKSWRLDLFSLIAETPDLTWLLLTKRPQNIVRLFAEACLDSRADSAPSATWWPRNAAIGCTVVTQAEANRDVPHLLRAKAALKPAFAFLSMEPLMEAVNLRCLKIGHDSLQCDALTGFYSASRQFVGALGSENMHRALAGMPKLPDQLPSVDWVITGGETDQGKHKARPSHPDWFRSLRDQCKAAIVPFHFKQWGEWHPPTAFSGAEGFKSEPLPMVRVGKKRSGRLLDGVLHDARPEVR